MQIRTMGCDRLWCGQGEMGRSIVLYYKWFCKKRQPVPTNRKGQKTCGPYFQLAANRERRDLWKKKKKRKPEWKCQCHPALMVEPVLFLWGSTDRSYVTSIDDIPVSG